MSLLTILLCSILNTDCVERAGEYYIIGIKYDFDPVLLIAIDIYECDLRDDVYAEFLDKNNKILAIDLCPMGLRVPGKFRKKLDRLGIIDQATQILDYFRTNTKKCQEAHAYLNHYNSGWKHVKNNYGWQVTAIYHTLLRKELTKYELNKLNSRTKQIIKDLKNDLYSTDI